MGNKPKLQEKDRRAKVEAMRREQQAKERRKSMLFIVVAVVVGVGLIAAAALPAYLDSRNDPKNKSLDSFGVSLASAGCGDVINDKATGGADHKPDGTRIDYSVVPPSSGPHWAQPAFPARAFYTADDRPAMEQLVHNLEHGYTILWYDQSIKGDQLQALKDISERARTEDAVGPNSKFVVSAWDDSYGTFPEGKHVALSHWGAQQGHRQLCGKVSGAAVAEFINQFPATDSPEPAAA